MVEQLVVHGAEWTVKDLFVYPNEFIYWSIQIVMYPYMTGLVAGAFVLSSLYHVFGQKDLKDCFSLVFSLALCRGDDALHDAASSRDQVLFTPTSPRPSPPSASYLPMPSC
jgi:hypothetical protein